MLSRPSRIVVLVAAAAVGTACSRDGSERSPEKSTPVADARAGADGKYPDPRWPSYFKPPQSVDDLMPAARNLARNTSGFLGVGMGVLKAGDSVLLVPTAEADPMVLEAIKRALTERKVKVHVKFTYEFLGQTREQVLREAKETKRGRRIADAGIYQASSWVTGQFPNPDVPKAWLKERRPDIYAELFPGESAGAPAAAAPAGDADDGQAMTGPEERDRVGRGIQEFMKAHPEVRGVFWGGGGSTGLRRALSRCTTSSSARSSRTTSTRSRARCRPIRATCGSSPKSSCSSRSCTWIAWRSPIPKGTNLWADMTEDMAQRWAQGAYQRGHLYMFPNQATGRFGYSFVNYPGVPAEMAAARADRADQRRASPARRATAGSSRAGRSPSRTASSADVKGGGAQGEALKEFLKYPGSTS